jgi:hypothetical protein
VRESGIVVVLTAAQVGRWFVDVFDQSESGYIWTDTDGRDHTADGVVTMLGFLGLDERWVLWTRADRGSHGYVYAMQGCPGDLIKIGYSTKPRQRLAQVSKDVKCPLMLLGFTHGSMALERSLHHELRAHRVHGEWYADCGHVRDRLARAGVLG